MYKETVDKTLHYLTAICNIQAVDYKKYRYFNLFQIYIIIIDVFILLDLLDSPQVECCWAKGAFTKTFCHVCLASYRFWVLVLRG